MAAAARPGPAQPGGARRGGGGRGGVPELRGEQGRQGDEERARQGEARQGHALLRLHRAGALPGRHEDRRQGRVGVVLGRMVAATFRRSVCVCVCESQISDRPSLKNLMLELKYAC